MKDAQVKGK